MSKIKRQKAQTRTTNETIHIKNADNQKKGQGHVNKNGAVQLDRFPF